MVLFRLSFGSVRSSGFGDENRSLNAEKGQGICTTKAAQLTKSFDHYYIFALIYSGHFFVVLHCQVS